MSAPFRAPPSSVPAVLGPHPAWAPVPFRRGKAFRGRAVGDQGPKQGLSWPCPSRSGSFHARAQLQGTPGRRTVRGIPSRRRPALRLLRPPVPGTRRRLRAPGSPAVPAAPAAVWWVPAPQGSGAGVSGRPRTLSHPPTPQSCARWRTRCWTCCGARRSCSACAPGCGAGPWPWPAPLRRSGSPRSPVAASSGSTQVPRTPCSAQPGPRPAPGFPKPCVFPGPRATRVRFQKRRPEPRRSTSGNDAPCRPQGEEEPRGRPRPEAVEGGGLR